MAEAYVYDAVRTPRGRGKKDGSLHEVPAVGSAPRCWRRCATATGSTPATVDDIIFGCVDPVGEAGSVIPRAAAFEAGYDNRGAGHADLALLRLGPRCHQFRRRQDRPGRRRDRHRRRRRIDVARRHGHVRRRLVHGPVGRHPRLFHAAGRLGRPDRHQIRLLAATTSTPMRSRARSAPPMPGRRAISRTRSCR